MDWIFATFARHDLHDQIGYIPQKGNLFSGTIESNLLYADENASQETLKEAVEIAQASEFIDSKPEGFANGNFPGRDKYFRRAETTPVHCPCAGQETTHLHF